MCLCCDSGIEGSDDEALDNGQDEEVNRWEQEQIRKGISIPQVSQSIITLPNFKLKINYPLVPDAGIVLKSLQK